MTLKAAPPPLNRETAQAVAIVVSGTLKECTVSIKLREPGKEAEFSGPRLPQTGREDASPQAVDSAKLHERLLQGAIIRQYRQDPVPDTKPIVASGTPITYPILAATSGVPIPQLGNKDITGHYLCGSFPLCNVGSPEYSITLVNYTAQSLLVPYLGQPLPASGLVATVTLPVNWLLGAEIGYGGTCAQSPALTSGPLWFDSAALASGLCVSVASTSAKHGQEETEDANTAAFLEEVYLLAESAQIRLAAARIMEYVDDLLREGQFGICDRLLNSVDVSRLSKYPTLLVAFLGITLGAKDKLPVSRGEFYSHAKMALEQELDQGRAERILRRFQ